MKFLGILFFTTLSLPLAAVACPIGMQFNGTGCSPPYEYTGWDLMRDRRAAIDAMGSNHRNSGPPLTAEQARKLNEGMKQLEKEKDAKRKALERGIWDVQSKPTPEGNLCAAVFSKYKLDEGGIVTIIGFQNPKPDAWLIFQGVGLPKSKTVTKMKIALQQDNEPEQTLQVFNYRETSDVGTIVFAVPGLIALLNGMSDTQRFKLSDNGKTLMNIEWHSAAPIIEKLRQCAK
jgi:hypothetical protein